MGLFENFPYTNFHEINLDQIIKIMRQMQDEWQQVETDWDSMQNFINNYFDNLDVSEEVLQALQTMAGDGELNTIIDPVIVAETAAWLAEHITPTSPAVDNTLSIAGAAADAKATGDAVADLKEDKLQKIFNYNLNDNYGFSPIVVGVPSGNAWGFSVEPRSYSVSNGTLTYSPQSRSDILRKGVNLINGHNYYVYLPIASASQDAFLSFGGANIARKYKNSFIENVFTWSSTTGFWFFQLQAAADFDYVVGGMLLIDLTDTEISQSKARLIGAYLRANSSVDISEPLQVFGLSHANSRTINIKDFGAIGDGVYDNTNVFVNAISACGNGDSVYVPSGVYLVENIQLKSNMRIYGDGCDSIIYMKSQMTNQNYNCLTVNDCDNVFIEDLHLYGNKDNNQTTQNNADSGWNGVHINGSTNIKINRLISESNGYHGIIMVDVDKIRITDSEFYNNGYRPIHGHGNIKNVDIGGCYCHENGQGFYGETGGGSSVGNGFDAIFFFDGVHNLNIHDNRIFEPNTLACIQIGGDLGVVNQTNSPQSIDIIINNNMCITTKSIKGIHVMGDVHNVEISSNAIVGGSDSIFIETTVSNKISTNLNIHDNTITPISFGLRARNGGKRFNVHNNTINGGNQFGMYFVGIEELLVNENIVLDSQFGIVFESSSFGIASSNVCSKITNMIKAVWAKDSCTKINMTNTIIPESTYITNSSTNGITENTISIA